jgi:thioredoxin-dependent peroxiredoxin
MVYSNMVRIAQVGLSLAACLAVGGIRAHAADLEVGQPAPDFQLPDENGKMHTLAEYKGRNLVLAFYPKDFTGG